MTELSQSDGPHHGQQKTRAMADDLDRQKEDLDFYVEISIRYHSRRQAHYELIHRSMMFLVILSGSAAFGNLFNSPRELGLAAAFWGSWDLVWSFSTKARDHYFLRCRFSDLANEIRGHHATDDALEKWRSKRVDIEKDEPPVYWAVAKDCFNEVSQARGLKGRESFSKAERLFMNWRRFEKLGAVASTLPTAGSPDARAPHPQRS